MKILRVQSDTSVPNPQGHPVPPCIMWIPVTSIVSIVKNIDDGTIWIEMKNNRVPVKADLDDLITRWQEGLGHWPVEDVSVGEMEEEETEN